MLTVATVTNNPSSAGPSAQDQQSRFRGGVDVVSLNVTVTDGGRRYITDLARDDFQILEDGRKQEVTFFQKSGVPLAVALLLSTSASMQDSLAIAQEAAIVFARGLEPADKASVIDFDATVRMLQGFTNDRGAIERAIRRTVANGSTALYNAIYIALRELRRARRSASNGATGLQAIVLLSDGDDTSSLIGFDEVQDVARPRGYHRTIYAIGLGPQEHKHSPLRGTRVPSSSCGGSRNKQAAAYSFPSSRGSFAAVHGETRQSCRVSIRWHMNRRTLGWRWSVSARHGSRSVDQAPSRGRGRDTTRPSR